MLLAYASRRPIKYIPVLFNLECWTVSLWCKKSAQKGYKTYFANSYLYEKKHILLKEI